MKYNPSTNLGIYLFTAFVMIVFKDPVKQIHSELVGISVDKLEQLYFSYLGNFKLAVIMLSFTPYVALKLMGY